MSHKQAFIEFCLEKNVLRFGKFTLKSGRNSPYFFNAGLFNTGEDLAMLGGFYAQTLQEVNLDYDLLFGPAYKGIPLVCGTAIALASLHGINKPFAFNRKETKDHGEKGNIVGADIRNKKILLIDDVITAGTAIAESVKILEPYEAKLSGIIIAFNRQEKGKGKKTAIEEIEQKYQVPVLSIINFHDLLAYLEHHKKHREHLQEMQAYWTSMQGS